MTRALPAGLQEGSAIRFRRHLTRGTWVEAVVAGVELDGSVACFDDDGRARAIRPEHVQVKMVGPRGGVRWEAVS